MLLLLLSTALRAAAAAVKHEDDRRLFHNAALRKRRKEIGEHRVRFYLRDLPTSFVDLYLLFSSSLHMNLFS